MVHNISTQVAAFEKLLGICNSFGAGYNPSNASLTTSALGVMLEQAQQIAKAEDHAYVNHKLMISVRREAYDALPRLLSRLIMAASVQEMSEENVRDLIEMKRTIVKPRNAHKPPPVGSIGTAPGPPKPSNRAIASFDWINSQFSRILAALEKMPAFRPNESDLTLESLKATLASLKEKTTAAVRTSIALREARRARNECYFGKKGLYVTSREVKQYVRSIAGVRSDQARQISAVKLQAKP